MRFAFVRSCALALLTLVAAGCTGSSGSTPGPVTPGILSGSVVSSGSNPDDALNLATSGSVTVEVVFNNPLSATDTVEVTLTDGGANTVVANATGFTTATVQITGIDASTLVDGAITVDVRFTRDGVTTPDFPGTPATKDTIVPAAPTAASIPASGDNPADYVNLTTAISVDTLVAVVADTTDSIEIILTDGSLATATVQGTGFSGAGPHTVTGLDASLLDEGAITVEARLIDAAGNPSTLFTGTPATIDTLAPATPVAPDLAAASDSGSSNTDDITNATTPTFDGTAEADSSIELFAGGVSVGTATADNLGVYSIAPLAALSDGAQTMHVTATDEAGNTSPDSPTLVATIDTVAPQPAAPDMQTASDSGASTSDDITNDDTPTFDVTVEALADATVRAGGAIVGTGTADGAGAASITASTLADLAHAITVEYTDLAGNTSLASPALNVTVDTATVAPSAPDLQIASDSGSSNNDDITNDNTPTFDITGAEANSSLTLRAGGVSVATGTADGSGNASLTSSSLADVSHSVTVEYTDLAGNTSAASTGTSVLVDTVAVAPAVPDMNAASDSGSSNSDDVTNVTTPLFDITGAEAGSTVRILAGVTVVATGTANGSGDFSGNTSALGNGSHTMTANFTDIAGNTSAASTGLSVEIDTVDPVPAVTFPNGPTDFVGDTTTITWGLTEANPGTVDLEYSENSGGVYNSIATGAADSGSYFWDTTLSGVSDGTALRVQVTSTDLAGNTGVGSVDASNGDFVLDRVDPVVSAITPNGGENISGTTNVLWTTTDANVDTVDIFLLDGGVVFGTPIASAAADTGTFSWDTTGGYPNSTQARVRVVATDKAGNTGQLDSAADFTLDNPIPQVTAMTPNGGEYVSGAAATVTWTVSGGTGAVTVDVELLKGGALVATLGTAVPATNGSLNFDSTAQADGNDYRVRITPTDSVPLSGPAVTSAADFTIDNTDPTVDVTSPDGTETLANTVSITWTATEANRDTVEIRYSTDSGATFPTVIAAAAPDNGSFSWDTTGVTESQTARVRITPTDLAGNTGTANDSAADFMVDNTDPTVVLTAPNGGENYFGTQNITWVTTDANPGTVDIDASSNGGTSYDIVVADDAPDTGTFSWDTNTVNTPNGTSYRIRITPTDAATRTGTAASSAANFTIDNAGPVITLTDPLDTATGVSTSQVITVTFDRDIDPASVTAPRFTLTNTTLTAAVPGTISFPSTTQIRFTPTSALADANDFEVFLSEDIEATNTFTLGTDTTFSFTTVDTTPPSFSAGASRPADDDALTNAEAVIQLQPARFVFTDNIGLDEASVTVVVDYGLTTLTQGVDYTVTPATDEIQVTLSPAILTSPNQSGERLVFTLSNVQDDAGNALPDSGLGAGVLEISTVYDPIAPVATRLFDTGGANNRAIFQFNETMDTAVTGGFVFHDVPTMTPVVVEPDDGAYLGSGFVTLTNTDDTFFFVPRDLLTVGTNYFMDVSTFQDVAGNVATGQTTSTELISGPMGTAPTILRAELRPAAGGAAVATITDLSNDFLVLPNTAVGTQQQLALVFDQELSPFSWGEIENEGDMVVEAQVVTTTLTNDTVLFDLDDPTYSDDPAVTWISLDQFELSVGANTPTGGFTNVELGGAVQNTATETTPPTLAAVIAPRGSSGNPATPSIRPGETLYVAFSEPIDRRALDGVTVALTGPSTNFRLDTSDSDWQLAIQGDDGVGNHAPFPAGTYTVTLQDIPDLSGAVLPNLMVLDTFNFTVETVSGGPSYLRSTPATGQTKINGRGYFPLNVSFDDAIDPDSFTDTTPLIADRGFRLEESLGGPLGPMIPLKGLRPQTGWNFGRGAWATVELIPDQLQVYRGERSYRLTLFDDITDIDGDALTSVPAPITFETAPDGNISGFPVVINEVDAETSGDTAEFVELYDGGVGNTSLNGLVLVFFNGSTDQSYYSVDLDGFSTDGNGYFLVGNAGVTGADIVFADGLLQNGADAVALYFDDASSFPNGTALTTSSLHDALVYDTDDADDTGLLTGLGISAQLNENANSSSLTESHSRLPDGSGNVADSASWGLALATPKSANQALDTRPSLYNAESEMEIFVPNTIAEPGKAVETFLEGYGSWEDQDAGDLFTFEIELNGVIPANGVAGPASDTNVDIELNGADLNNLNEGQFNDVRMIVTDTALNETSLQSELWMFKQATLIAATPSVVEGSPGVFTFSGSVADLTDGPNVRAVSIFVVEVDTVPAIPELAGFAYNNYAQVTRAADGSLTFSHTMAADMRLPQLTAPNRQYMAVAILTAARGEASKDDFVDGFSQPTATFNAAP